MSLIHAKSKARQLGLDLLMVDLRKDGRMSAETLRYFLEHLS